MFHFSQLAAQRCARFQRTTALTATGCAFYKKLALQGNISCEPTKRVKPESNQMNRDKFRQSEEYHLL